MSVEQAVARLETLSPAGLRDEWVRVTASAVPRVSPRLLRLALAWELQARAYGGLSREIVRTLRLDPTHTPIAATTLSRRPTDNARAIHAGLQHQQGS